MNLFRPGSLLFLVGASAAQGRKNPIGATGLTCEVGSLELSVPFESIALVELVGKFYSEKVSWPGLHFS